MKERRELKNTKERREEGRNENGTKIWKKRRRKKDVKRGRKEEKKTMSASYTVILRLTSDPANEFFG